MEKLKKKIVPVKQKGELDYDEWYIMHGGFHEYIRKFNPNEFNGFKAFPVNYLNHNPWKALESIKKIDSSKLKDLCKYEDWITKNEAYGLIPLTIFTYEIEPYLEGVDIPHYLRDMILDDEWNQRSDMNPYQNTDNYSEHHISKILMGTGYEECIIPSDGSWQYKLGVVDLDNGDKLHCLHYVWYNK